MRIDSRQRTVGLLLFLILTTFGARMGRAEDAKDPLARMCDLGITYALSGDEVAAESTFVSLLSRSPGDARALNNLGNLRLWRGDTGLALAFYESASREDSTDAGITLNQAEALMIGGEDEAARERAGEGVRRAGGPEAAARLLGLHYTAPDDRDARGSDRAQVSRDEVLALLRAATQAIPADTVRTAPAPKNLKARKPVPAWRPAGARGAGGSDVTAIVYWKR